jgi:DNA-binding MarR family transcriptional regulator
MTNNIEVMGEPLPVFRHFMNVSRIFYKEADSYLEKLFGVSSGKFAVLMALYFNDGPVSSSNLARITVTRPNNITALVQRLKKQNLVTTDKEAADLRFVMVRLTPEGQALMDKAMPAARQFVMSTMAGFDEKEAVALDSCLTRLEKNLVSKKHT